MQSLGRLRVGIQWQGSFKGKYERRDIPREQFKPLSTIPGVTLISLQQPSAGVPTDLFVDFGPLDAEGAFLDTAAIMKNLDLVITCDTSIAHLAGALGLPVWVALPLCCDWRWLRDRDDSIVHHSFCRNTLAVGAVSWREN